MYSWWALNFFVIQVEIKVNSKLLGSWIFCISQYLWRANLCNYCQGYHNQIIRGNSCIYFFLFYISRTWVGLSVKLCSFALFLSWKEYRKTVLIFAKSILLQEKREEIIDRKQSICQTYILVSLKTLQRHPSLLYRI